MAANTRDEDRALAKTARAAIARTSLDITQLNIACRGGIIEMDGKVRAPRGGAGSINVRREFQIIKTQIHAVRGVREVYGDRVAILE